MSFFEPSAGPLANDIQALRILCRSVLSTRPAMYDATALDVPWRDLEVPPSAPKLRLGLLTEDSAFPLHPPVKRALAQAVRVLEAKGHQVVPISPSRAQVSNALALGFAYFGLGEPPAHIAASGEPLVPSVIQAMQTFGSFKCDFLADCEGLQGIPRVAALNVKRESIADEWRTVWRDERLDAVIGPAAQNTAVAHDTYGLPPYTLLLNVLDVSCGQTSENAKKRLLLTAVAVSRMHHTFRQSIECS
jgi:amidase